MWVHFPPKRSRSMYARRINVSRRQRSVAFSEPLWRWDDGAGRRQIVRSQRNMGLDSKCCWHVASARRLRIVKARSVSLPRASSVSDLDSQIPQQGSYLLCLLGLY